MSEWLIRPGTTDDLVASGIDLGYHWPPVTIVPSTVLDLGCNIGLTTSDYERRWPDARIFGVEMDIDNATVARKNCASPILCAAVAGEPGQRLYSTADGAWAYRLDDAGTLVTQSVTLDQLVARMGGHVDFVKMDIEGSEWEVLPTGRWETGVASLLIEVHPETIENVEQAIDLLAWKGYTAVGGLPPRGAAVWATKMAA